MSEPTLLYEFEKNAAELVRAEITKWNGRDIFNLRVFFDVSKNGQPDWRPTKKGLAVRTELIPEVKKAVDLAFAHYENNAQ